MLRDALLRQHVWHTLMAAPRTSTYTFVSSGDADVSDLHSAGAARSRSGQPGGVTLRQLLHSPEAGAQPSGRDRTLAALPAMIDLLAPRDPRLACTIADAQVDELLAYFDEHLKPWLGVMDGEGWALPDMASRPFLLCTVLYVAARYRPSLTCADWIARLAAHTRTLAVLAFAEAQCSLDVVLAFLLLTVWKSPDDDFSELYLGYADRIAALHGGVTFASAKRGDALHVQASRRDERILLFNHVQQNVYVLHHCPPGRQAGVGDAALGLHLSAWARSPDAQACDWFLACDAASTELQLRYRTALDQLERFDTHLGSAAQTSLLARFVGDLEAWEAQWTFESRLAAWQSHLAANRRTVGLFLFRNSVKMQVCAVALKSALRAALQAAAGDNNKRVSLSSADAVERTFRLCLDGALGVLAQMPLLSATELAHIPDSLVVLAAHAALLVIYLHLLPAALADAGYEGLTFASISNLAAPQSMGSIRAAAAAMSAAASALPASAAENAVHLSARYLDALCRLVEPTREASAADALVAIGEQTLLDGDMATDELGWDWLQAFLAAPGAGFAA
jgi:hypothetical protein